MQACTLHTFFDISVHIYVHNRCRVCTCARVCTACSLCWGTRTRRVSYSMESTCCFACFFIFDRWRNRGVVWVFSVLGVYVGVCVCIRTHAHTLHMGYSDVSPRVGTRHLESPKNPDGLNLSIYVFVYVYTVHMCTYVLRSGMRSWSDCFFPSTYWVLTIRLVQ